SPPVSVGPARSRRSPCRSPRHAGRWCPAAGRPLRTSARSRRITRGRRDQLVEPLAMKLALALAAGTVASTTMTLTANAGTDGATTPVDDRPFAAMLALAPESAAKLGATTTIQYTDLAALWRRAGVEGSA